MEIYEELTSRTKTHMETDEMSTLKTALGSILIVLALLAWLLLYAWITSNIGPG